MKHCHILARSTYIKRDDWLMNLRHNIHSSSGSICKDLFMKYSHINARSTGSNWDGWLKKYRHLFARRTGRI
jgi:hypothetical protein